MADNEEIKNFEHQRFTSIEHQINAQDQRIQSVERALREVHTDHAVRIERDKHLDKRLDSIETGVGEVKGYLLRIVWVVIISILTAFIAFIVKGGLSAGI